jgi:hypothetical protein
VKMAMGMRLGAGGVPMLPFAGDPNGVGGPTPVVGQVLVDTVGGGVYQGTRGGRFSGNDSAFWAGTPASVREPWTILTQFFLPAGAFPSAFPRIIHVQVAPNIFLIMFMQSRTIRVQINDPLLTPVSGFRDITHPYSIPDNSWVWAGATWDGTRLACTLAGQALAQTTTAQGTQSATGDAGIYIGNRPGFDRVFGGFIPRLIYARQGLTNAQLQAAVDGKTFAPCSDFDYDPNAYGDVDTLTIREPNGRDLTLIDASPETFWQAYWRRIA